MDGWGGGHGFGVGASTVSAKATFPHILTRGEQISGDGRRGIRITEQVISGLWMPDVRVEQSRASKPVDAKPGPSQEERGYVQ